MTNLLTLKNYIKNEEDKGNLIRIKKEVKREFEIAAILDKFDDGPIILFEKIKDFDIKVVGNVCSNRKRLYEAMNMNEENYHEKIYFAMENPLPCEIVNSPYFKSDPEIKVKDLPIPKHYENDASYYITSGIVIAREEDFQNASTHRLMYIDEETFGIRIVPRHLYSMLQEAKKKGKVLNVAICIGVHPAVALAAGLSPNYKIDHIHVANRLMNNSFHQFKCDNGVYALAESEIILEGYIDPFEEINEGPFTDLTGTADIVRKQPAVHIKKVYACKESLYQDILPARNEHFLLMGLGREVLIRKYVERITPFVNKVRLIKGGCGWLIAAVSARKIREGDGKNIIAACFAAHPSLKIAIVVDEDIDIDNMDEIFWALSTRLNPAKGIIVIEDATISSLDPSSNQELSLGNKVGIDATRSFLKPYEKYKRSNIPISKERIDELIKDVTK
jgi:UbiD family decarboxylase